MFYNTMIKQPIIWILWWMWADALSDIYNKIIKKYQENGSIYGDSLPEFRIVTLPFPNIATSSFDEDELSKILIKWSKMLKEVGADFIVVPCNSIHEILHKIENQLDLPLVSLIRETAKYVKRFKIKRLLIVGTENTRKSKIFDNEIDDTIECIHLTDQDQIIVSELITKVLKKEYTINEKELLDQIIECYNVDMAILWCAELPLLVWSTYNQKKYIDTIKVIADSLYS